MPPKCKLISPFFQYWDSIIGLFSIAPCKVNALIIFAFFLVSVLI